MCLKLTGQLIRHIIRGSLSQAAGCCIILSCLLQMDKMISELLHHDMNNSLKACYIKTVTSVFTLMAFKILQSFLM
jgi:hypothetical protein